MGVSCRGEVSRLWGKKEDLNISRLIELGDKHGKTVVVLVAISPNPLLANGGIPSSLAVNNSITEQGVVAHSLVSHDLVKMYSFFDPHVYKAFSQFAQELSLSLKTEVGKFHVLQQLSLVVLKPVNLAHTLMIIVTVLKSI